jgi:hypothetical protein
MISNSIEKIRCAIGFGNKIWYVVCYTIEISKSKRTTFIVIATLSDVAFLPVDYLIKTPLPCKLTARKQFLFTKQYIFKTLQWLQMMLRNDKM